MRSFAFVTSSLAMLSSSPLASRSSNIGSNNNKNRDLSTHATIRRDADEGTVILMPKDEARHSATVILCHGLGDTAEGWVDPAQYLASQLPHVKFVLPTAPIRPVTLNMGLSMPAWYDIVGLDSRSNELCDGIDDSISTILSLVETEVISEGNNDGDSTDSCTSGGIKAIDYSRIVLAGFSQGGALALFTGLSGTRSERPHGLGLAGIVVMSGYLPQPKMLSIASGSESTPILHCHGMEDSVVPVAATSLSRDHVMPLMEKMGGESGLYETKIYPGLDHGVSMQVLNDIVMFLRRVIPDGAQAKAEQSDPSKMSTRQLRNAIKRAGLEEQARGMLEKSELVNLLLQYQHKAKK